MYSFVSADDECRGHRERKENLRSALLSVPHRREGWQAQDGTEPERTLWEENRPGTGVRLHRSEQG